ncbi:MAG: tetratricopeptide repeat protein [Thermoguttaceae bacterium]
MKFFKSWYRKGLGVAFLLTVALLTGACVPKDDPPSSNVEDFAAEGRDSLDSGDWSRAYDAFSKVIEKTPTDVDAYYGRAASSLARAQDHYSLAQANATNQKIEEGQKEAAKADEYFQKAAEDADKIIDLDPKYIDAWFLKGVVCQYQGMWEDGIKAFSECVKLDPERGEAFHRRGEIYDHIGDYMNASVDFKKASELGFAAPDPVSPTLNEDDLSDLNYEVDNADASDSGEADANDSQETSEKE